MSLSSLPAAQPDPRMTRRCLPVVTGLSARSNDQHENNPIPMHLAHAYKSFAIPLQWLTLPGTVFTPLQGWLLRAQAGRAATVVSFWGNKGPLPSLDMSLVDLRSCIWDISDVY